MIDSVKLEFFTRNGSVHCTCRMRMVEEMYKHCQELSDIIAPIREVNRRFQQVSLIFYYLINVAHLVSVLVRVCICPEHKGVGRLSNFSLNNLTNHLMRTKHSSFMSIHHLHDETFEAVHCCIYKSTQSRT